MLAGMGFLNTFSLSPVLSKPGGPARLRVISCHSFNGGGGCSEKIFGCVVDVFSLTQSWRVCLPLPRYTMHILIPGGIRVAELISTEQLMKNLALPAQRILDARSGFVAYEENHIPGAQFLHVETLRMTEEGVPCKMLPVSMLSIIFGRLGITVDSPVVIYATNPSDHLSATYLGWTLAVSGNDHFLLLDGNLRKWADEDLPLTQRFPEVAEALFHGAFNSEIFADWAYVLENLREEDTVLVDTRTHASYSGEIGPTQRHGHIPGAILHNYLWDYAPDGTYYPVDLLREHYAREGITPDKEVISYCVTGREASAVWFVLKYLLGYPHVRLYQASLTEWCARPELPLVTGETPWGDMRREAA